MFQLSPVEKLAYKERSHHEHPDLLEKLGKMLKAPIDTKNFENDFSCHTKTVCKKRKKKRGTVKKKRSFFGLFQ